MEIAFITILKIAQALEDEKNKNSAAKGEEHEEQYDQRFLSAVLTFAHKNPLRIRDNTY